MRIVFAASECVPFAKTGGLADVVGALGPEMVKLGHEVTVYLPFYARVRPRIEGELKYVAQSITIPFEYYNRFVGIVDGGTRDGVKYYFVDCPELFDRQELYGTRTGDYPDNAERFGRCWRRRNCLACLMCFMCMTGRRRWCRCTCGRCTRVIRCYAVPRWC